MGSRENCQSSIFQTSAGGTDLSIQTDVLPERWVWCKFFWQETYT